MATTPTDTEEPPKPADHSDILTSAINFPTIFADGCLFARRMGSTVRLTFVESMIEPSDGPFPGFKTRHVGTLIMPVEGFRATLGYLNRMADMLTEDASGG